MIPTLPTRARRLAIVLFLVAGWSDTTRAAVVARVRQGSTEWTIRPIQSSTDVPPFYRYGNPDASCANTGLETDGTSLLFLYDDPLVIGPSPSVLALVMIHDARGNAAGGSAVFNVFGLPATATYAVRDDPADSYAPDPPVAGATTASWTWGVSDNDGAAFGGMGSAPFCLAIEPTFTSGIDTWQTLDGPSTTTPTAFTIPSLSETVHICVDCLRLTCTGATVTACDDGTAYAPVRATGSSLCGSPVITNDRNAGGADASDAYPLGRTDVTFTMVDGAGFASSCTATVEVTPNPTPPTIIACPPALTLDCAGLADLPSTDPRVQDWLAQFSATDDCLGVALAHDAPSFFPAGCHGSVTPVTFTATDASGNVATCNSSVAVHTECLAPPRDVAGGLRVTSHGDPLGAQVAATLDWSRDAGLPRTDEHYHVLRGEDPSLLVQVPGTEPWTLTTLDESTPAATSLPLVHFYSVLAAGPCEDVSAD